MLTKKIYQFYQCQRNSKTQILHKSISKTNSVFLEYFKMANLIFYKVG